MATPKIKKSAAVKTAELFGLIAGTTRVMILATLMKNKEVAVQDIAAAAGMTHSAVSHQLGMLLGADIVASRKEGRLMYYRIGSGKEAKALVKFLAAML